MQGVNMESGMGTFSVACVVENHLDRSRSARVAPILVDTGSDSTWIPEAVLRSIGVREEKTMSFVTADGKTATRLVGFAIIRIDGRFTTDEVVFAREGDLALLGARALEGMDLCVDPRNRRLIDRGPRTAAASAPRVPARPTTAPRCRSKRTAA